MLNGGVAARRGGRLWAHLHGHRLARHIGEVPLIHFGFRVYGRAARSLAECAR